MNLDFTFSSIAILVVAYYFIRKNSNKIFEAISLFKYEFLWAAGMLQSVVQHLIF